MTTLPVTSRFDLTDPQWAILELAIRWEAMAHRMLTATGRAERLLDGLLALARSDRGVIAQEPHDLAVAAAVALSEADGEAERAELTIATDLRPAPVGGDPALLDRLVSNLVDNAIRHNRPGGWIEGEAPAGRAVGPPTTHGARYAAAAVGPPTPDPLVCEPGPALTVACPARRLWTTVVDRHDI